MTRRHHLYEVRVHDRARKEIREVANASERRRILNRIASLATNPRPPGAQKLGGYDAYRVRQGDYRIVYTMRDVILTVCLILLGKRYREDVTVGSGTTTDAGRR